MKIYEFKSELPLVWLAPRFLVRPDVKIIFLFSAVTLPQSFDDGGTKKP